MGSAALPLPRAYLLHRRLAISSFHALHFPSNSLGLKALLPAQAMDNAESSDEEGAARDAKRVVVAWWKDDISGLLASLAAFAPRGSQISIVCQEQPEVRASPCACERPLSEEPASRHGNPHLRDFKKNIAKGCAPFVLCLLKCSWHAY